MVQDLDVAQRLDRASRHLELTRWACESLPSLSGMRLAATVHIDVMFAVAALQLRHLGAEVFLAAASPHTTRDDVRMVLEEHGIVSHAWRGMTEADRLEGVAKALAWGPTHTCEMGADISVLAARTAHPGIVAGLEATQTGINRLADVRPTYPLFNWDPVPITAGLHNRYAVGRSAWMTFVSRTQLSLQGRRGPVAVATTSAVGSRSSRSPIRQPACRPVRRRTGSRSAIITSPPRARAMSASPCPTGPNPTIRSRRGVLTAERLALLPAGAFLLNAGHADDEIELAALTQRRELVPYVESCRVGDEELYLVAGGAPANITAGFGDTLDPST